MHHIKGLLLRLGLFLVFYHVHSGKVRILGGSPYNMNEDMSGALAQLNARKAYLEAQIASASSPAQIWFLQRDLDVLKDRIAHWEPSLRVPYTDYVTSLSEQREEFEREKALLRTKLVEAEDKRLQAIDALSSQKQLQGAAVESYTEALNTATNERNMIASEYAKFTEAYHQQEEKLKQERDHFLTQKEKLQQTLDEAKKRHSQVLEFLSATPTGEYSTTQIPEQGEINTLREDITAFNGMTDRKKLKEGLETTKTKLLELLDRLHKAGNFSSNASLEDIQRVLGEVETSILLEKQDQENQRKSLVEQLKKGDLSSYSDTEIAALQKVNEEMAAVDKLQKDLARRNAYLKGIVEVSDLINECSNAIQDANERNLANLWAEGIQGAMDSPFFKECSNALQYAKNSIVTLFRS